MMYNNENVVYSLNLNIRYLLPSPFSINHSQVLDLTLRIHCQTSEFEGRLVRGGEEGVVMQDNKTWPREEDAVENDEAMW